MGATVEAHEIAASLRAGLVGRVGRHCPVAGRGIWASRLNADFEDGSRPWQGDIYVPNDRWLLLVKTWPDPQTRRRDTRGGHWEDYEPHLDVAHGLIGLAGHEAGRSLVEWLPVAHGNAAPHAGPTATAPTAPVNDWAWRAIGLIPENIRSKLARFRFGQWRLLRLVAREPAVLDLIGSNPALAWAAASAGAFLDHPPNDSERAALEHVGQRQRDIAAWLGFPPNEGSVRLLKKVPPDSCGVVPLLELRKLASNAEAAERLRHLRELPATVILAVGSRILGPSLTPAALRQIVEEIAQIRNGRRSQPANEPRAPGPTVAHLLEDAAQMAQMLPGANSPRPVHSVRALRRRHDELVDEFNRFAAPREIAPPPPPVAQPQRAAPVAAAAPIIAPAHEFPPPPLPAGPGIEPITTPAGLAHEGRAQHNCVASYADRVLSGSYYVYRVTKPSRATLGLQCERKGCWRIDQLAGPRNQPVSMELRSHVLNWFHACIRKRLEAVGEKPPTPRRRQNRPPEDPARPLLPGI